MGSQLIYFFSESKLAAHSFSSYLLEFEMIEEIRLQFLRVLSQGLEQHWKNKTKLKKPLTLLQNIISF